MKNLALFLLVAMFMTAGSVRADGEIAFVNWQEVFKQFYKTQLAQDQIREQLDTFEMERKAFEDEVQAMRSEIDTLRSEARDDTLTEDMRASKRDLLEEKLVALQQKEQEMAEFNQLRQDQLDQQNARMTKRLFDEIQAGVIDYAKARNFVAVIDSSASSRVGTDVVMYTSPEVDITAEILAMLNEGRRIEPRIVEEAEGSDDANRPEQELLNNSE